MSRFVSPFASTPVLLFVSIPDRVRLVRAFFGVSRACFRVAPLAARALGLLTAFLLTGCGVFDEQHPDPLREVGRYVDLRNHQVRSDELLASLAREASRAEREYEIINAEIEEATPSRLVLRSRGGENGYLDWPVVLDPDEIFELELAATTDQPCVVRLFWREEGAAFSFQRSVGWPMPVPGSQRARRTMRGRSGFAKEIVEVRLQIEGPQPVRLEVETLSTLGWDSDLGLDDEAAESLLAMRFGSEVRPSFLLRPGDERVQKIPPGSWQLRGAAVQSGAEVQRLALALNTAGGDAIERIYEIEPVVPTGETLLWSPVVWNVVLREEAELVYRISEESSDRSLIVAALKPTPRGQESAPRAILVSLDTVRADVLGIYGAKGNPSPALDRLAARSWVFDNAYSTSSWTLPAHMSMLTGFWPARHTVEGGNRIYAPNGWSLARHLRDAGFWTEAWTEGGFVDARFGFAHGFDRYVVLPSNHMMKQAVSGSLVSLEELEGPTFLFLHTYQAHAPYDPDPEYFARHAGRSDSEALPSRTELWAWMEDWRRDGKRLSEEKLDWLRAAYQAGIPQVDREIERFLSGLEPLRTAAPDLLVVTSDHGDVFQERSDLLEHGRELQPELLRVPLIVSTGAALAVGRRQEIASVADLPATILELLGIPGVETDGRALLVEPNQERPPRDWVQAGVQPPFTSTYRLARVGAGWVDSIEIGDSVGPIERLRLGDPESSEAPEAQSELSAIWSANHRGRTEVAIRFAEPQSDLSLRLRSSGRIFDAVVWPSVSARVSHDGEHEVSISLMAERPTHWVSLLLEMDPPDSGLVVEVPERAGPLRFVCGSRPDVEDPVECARWLVRSGGGSGTLNQDSGGWVRVLRHPGRPFRTPEASTFVSDGSARVDSALQAQLEALGYADFEVDEPSGQEATQAGPARTEAEAAAARPGEVALVRTRGD